MIPIHNIHNRKLSSFEILRHLDYSFMTFSIYKKSKKWVYSYSYFLGQNKQQVYINTWFNSYFSFATFLKIFTEGIKKWRDSKY